MGADWAWRGGVQVERQTLHVLEMSFSNDENYSPSWALSQASSLSSRTWSLFLHNGIDQYDSQSIILGRPLSIRIQRFQEGLPQLIQPLTRYI